MLLTACQTTSGAYIHLPELRLGFAPYFQWYTKLTKESATKEIPYIKPLQRTQLRVDFTNNQVASLACIYLTKTEHYQLDHFIGQYIQTRSLLSIPNIKQVLGSILERYPGKSPVMVNELNAWIDRKLGYRATHPDFSQLLE